VRYFYLNAENNASLGTTNYLKLSRGVRQGCTRSPYLFILGALGILAARVRHERNIEGVRILEKEYKISQFADDTSMFQKIITSVI